METIRIFLGILLIICLLLSVDYRIINDYFKEQKSSEEYTHAEKVLGLEVKDYKGRVKIIDVFEYTPARKAGLEVGDRILEVNGKKVINSQNFVDKITNICDEKPIRLVVHRIDSRSTFPVEIEPTRVSFNP